MDLAMRLSEERIREAVENGDFDNLKLKGKPLKLEDLSTVPEELRMSYKILKNAGAIPEEVQLKKDMVTLQDLISCCVNEDESIELKKELNEKLLRYNMLMEKKKLSRSSAFRQYKDKINRRLFY